MHRSDNPESRHAKQIELPSPLQGRAGYRISHAEIARHQAAERARQCTVCQEADQACITPEACRLADPVPAKQAGPRLVGRVWRALFVGIAALFACIALGALLASFSNPTPASSPAASGATR